VLCFTVQHMGGARRSCSALPEEEGGGARGAWREGMLVVERLGRPTITAVLLKRAAVVPGGKAEEEEEAPLPASLLVAWCRFRIRVVSEDAAVALVLAPRVRRARARYAPSLRDYYLQDPGVTSAAADTAALQYLIGNAVIVNLARRPALLSRVTHLLQRTPPFNRMSRVSRFEAVDGASLDLGDLVRSRTLSQEGMDSALRAGVRVEAIQLTRGAIGCALSHVRLWQQIAADHGRGATLVLEDDVYFASEFEARLRDAVAHLPANFSMVYLNLPDYASRSDISASGGTTVRAVLGDNYGTSAYIVSPAGARALLRGVMPLTQQIDSHIIAVTERSVRRESGGAAAAAAAAEEPEEAPFDVYTVDPPLVYELKTLHKSDVQVGL
jgi:GR25 family glycosyltransferase involved in LPS biosynthesis